MRHILLLSVIAFATTVPAQTPAAAGDANVLAASKQRLENALTKSAALQDTAFVAEWGPTTKPGKDDALAMMMAGRNSGKVTGSWHKDQVRCSFDGDEGDQLVTVGRRSIVRSADQEWTVRNARFADGNALDFVPDAELLLQQLQQWKLAIVHREVGSIDDRPVEIVTVTLNQDQVAEALWTGMLPAAVVSGAGGVFRFAMGRMGGGAAARTAADKPDAIVDVAIAIDPATSLVQRLQFRAYAAENAGRAAAAGGVLVVRGAALQVGGKAEEAEEEAEDEDVDANAPLVYENGLPKRSQKKKTVSDFTVRFQDHGTKVAPPLTDAQKKLLRL